MSKFWAKCGKILTDGNKVVKCNNSPCGYYGIFGIKYRWLNQDTMEPTNNCSWSYSVAPYEVINNAIRWSDMYTICLSVNRNVGECLHTKVKTGCWEDCVEWDEDWQHCIRTEEYCDFCVELYVYNLIGCYDNFQEFQQVFWGGCEVQPPYPSIWETWYGNKYPTSEAYNCIENYWNKYFCDRYMLSYNLIKYSKVQWWTLWVGTRYQEIQHCYCYGDGCDYQEVSPGDDCPAGCEKECWSDQGDPIDAGPTANQYTGIYERGDLVNHFYDGSLNAWRNPCPWGAQYSPCWYDDCCFQNSLYASAGPANAFMLGHINNKSSYTDGGSTNYSCTNSNSLCHDFSYRSSPYDNPYGDVGCVRYSINWATLRLEKNASTPSGAAGVKFAYTITQAKRNEGYGRGSENINTTSGFLSLNFNQDYQDLPLANNINGLTVVQGLDCNGNCEYGQRWQVKTQPHVTFWYQDVWDNDVLTDEVSVSLSAVEYI